MSNDIHKKIWTKEEEEMLLKIYDIYDSKELAEMFDTNYRSVNAKKRALGIGKEKFKKEIPEGYKRCSDCEEVLSEENFQRRSKTDTTVGRYSICKDCNRLIKSIKFKERKIERYKTLIDNYINNNKNADLICSRCNRINKISTYEILVNGKGKLIKKCSNCNNNTLLK